MSSLYCYSVFSLNFRFPGLTPARWIGVSSSARIALTFSPLFLRSVLSPYIRHRSSVYLRHSFCCAWCTIFLSCRNSLHGAIAVHLYRGHAGCRIPKGCSPFCGVQGRRPCRGIQGGRAHLASLGRCGAASGAKVACHFAKLA